MTNYCERIHMETVIIDKASSVINLTSGIPEGIPLSTIIIVIYVHDAQQSLNNDINLLSGDVNLKKRIVNDCKRRMLQRIV